MEQLLPESDVDFLDEKFEHYELKRVNGAIHLIIKDFDFPEQYTPRISDLLIILPAGYPSANPDMFWTFPDVKLANGQWPQKSEAHKIYDGTNWQRWSRHLPPGSWRAGIDNIKTFLASVRKEIKKGI